MKEPEPSRAAGPEASARKGLRTRALILATALRLFRERGYEETSMRTIADEAGVSVGNAYHYFDSKEHLVQAFYEQTHAEHLAACEAVLARETDLEARLRGVLLAKIDTAEPYHHLSALLFRTAADPKSPLNPFSRESGPVRDAATALMRRVLDGSGSRVPADLAPEMPGLLWLFEMSIILFWIHDESRDRARTRRLIERSVPMVAKLISLASFPLMGSMRAEIVALLAELRDEPVSPRKSRSRGKRK
jgi:AcrR family transcriptional regulator